MRINGACHCGNLHFTLDWRPVPERIPARACSCSFCGKHGGVWTSCPGGALRVVIERPDDVGCYAFGTRTASFHVCRTCGVVPVVTSRIDEKLYAVVNVNTLALDPALIERAGVSFDGEDEAARLARRARNWIGEVVFEKAGAG